MSTILTNLVPLASIGIGCFLLYVAWRSYASTRNMNSWELTQGIVTKSAVKQAGGTLLPDVEYQYFVLGTEYKGNNVTIPPDIIEDVEVAQGLLAEYPVGKKVDVFYNPKVHRVAVLEKQAAVGVWWVLFITIGAALISLIFGIGLLLG